MKHLGAWVLSFSVILSSACLEDHDHLVPQIDSAPAGGIRSVDVLSVSGNKAVIEMTFFAVDHFGTFITDINTDDLSVNGSLNIAMEISNLSLEREQDKGPYSATLLFDQSGSIQNTDPKDVRIEAGRTFAGSLGDRDEVSIVAFARSPIYNYPVEYLADFSSISSVLIPAIESLAGNASGGTPLYLALTEMTQYTSNEAKNSNKAIVAFTDGENTQRGVTIEEVIQYAQTEDVNIYTVGLGASVDFEDLSELAFQTGGAVMLAEDAAQLIALYGSLSQLLHGQAELYKVQLEMINDSNQWQIGQVASGTLVLQLSESLVLKYPFQKRIL